MKNPLKRFVKSLPYVRETYLAKDKLVHQREQLIHENDQLRQAVETLKRENEKFKINQFYEPGHFHSPLPDVEDIRQREEEIFDTIPRSLPAIDLNEEGQLSLLYRLKNYYSDLPFAAHKQPGLRYYYENDYYSYSDAIFLYSFLRHFRPRRLIEIGSGYSSCVVLDTNEFFLDNTLSCTFIDPNPERFYGLMKESDRPHIDLIPSPLHEVPLETFSALNAGDVLFVDSTHVAKTGSDVNRILFEILPLISPGVYIHFHDIFYPFEYIKQWVYQGWGWNECYLLRAFLQYNSAYQVLLFNTFLEHFHTDWFQQDMPLCLKNLGGSLWLQKL